MKKTDLETETIQSIFWSSQKNKFFLLSRPSFAKVYYKNYSLNLLNNSKESEGIDVLFSQWKLRKLKSRHKGFIVSHLFYELGNIDVDRPLAIEIHYQSAGPIDFSKEAPEFKFRLKSGPSFQSYKVKFDQVMSHLKDGDCYQVNLTERFTFINESLKPASAWDYVFKLYGQQKNLSPFAHATLLPNLNALILSNSPECLVQRDGSKLIARPMKGTLPCGIGEEERVKKQFQKSVKNKAELDMITDLIRNDLSSLGRPRSEVLARLKFIKVPGLLQQYSLIGKELTQDLNWFDLAKLVFPGGSVTGAPKKNVMGLIKKIESEARGIYCGSTFLQTPNQFSSSINIRTAWVNLKLSELTYGSGGGITLLSDPKEEFDEMNQKVSSFLSLFS